MSTIWIIREPRSGSTWFTHHVVEQLKFEHCFIDRSVVGLPSSESTLEFNSEVVLTEINKFSTTNTIFSTHLFSILRMMDGFEDPIIIRCARRNTLDQFLSHRLAKSTNYKFTNITSDVHREVFDNLVESRLLIPKKDLTEYLRLKRRNDDIWNEFAPKFKNFTVYYEDLCENGVDIPLLNMYNCKIGENGFTQKLPDYKTKVFLNYDMIQKWISEY